jgi:FKBP-type peptidyl-prolyl cis-trans isomerase 2
MAKKQEAKAPPKAAVVAKKKKEAPKPERKLLEVGQLVNVRGDLRTWQIIGVNADNYRIKFNHDLVGMDEEKNMPFGDVEPL